MQFSENRYHLAHPYLESATALSDNIDMKKATSFNHILSLDREYMPRNYFKNVTFSLLNMNRGN